MKARGFKTAKLRVKNAELSEDGIAISIASIGRYLNKPVAIS
jgi:uncharacterized protein (UPF0212 family)